MVVTGAGPGPGPGDELVQDVIPYRRRSRLLWGTVLPFCVLYPLWLWFWGPCAWAWAWAWEGAAGAETPEAALLCLAAIGAVHLLTALAGLWSVNVHCFLYCCWVSHASGSRELKSSARGGEWVYRDRYFFLIQANFFCSFNTVGSLFIRLLALYTGSNQL